MLSLPAQIQFAPIPVHHFSVVPEYSLVRLVSPTTTLEAAYQYAMEQIEPLVKKLFENASDAIRFDTSVPGGRWLVYTEGMVVVVSAIKSSMCLNKQIHYNVSFQLFIQTDWKRIMSTAMVHRVMELHVALANSVRNPILEYLQKSEENQDVVNAVAFLFKDE